MSDDYASNIQECSERQNRDRARRNADLKTRARDSVVNYDLGAAGPV